MIPVDSIFRLLASSLSIWESKEKTKYIDKYIKLKKDYYEESNKENPDYAVLDILLFELRLLVDATSANFEKPHSSNTSER